MCVARHAQITQNNNFPISLQYRKESSDEVVVFFGTHISMKACYKLIAWFWCGCLSISKVPKIATLQCFYNVSKKKLKMKLIFCMEINIKVSRKFISSLWASKFPTRLILSLLMGMIKHSQITQSNKFAISLQYSKSEVRNGGHSLHADKRQSVY